MQRLLSCTALAAALLVSSCSNDSNNPDAFQVTAHSPQDGATGVSPTAVIVVTFNRTPKQSSVQFSATPSIDTTPAFNQTAVTFTPNTPLAPSTPYTVTIAATDANGKALATPLSFTFTTAAAADTTPPAAITDLAVVQGSQTATGMTLSWTAPGDDGTSGTAAAYELRYATGAACPLTDANFESATLVLGLGVPQAAGSAETAAVTNLSAGTTYCFAIRTADEVPNISPLSNVATGTTLSQSAPTAPALSVSAITTSSVEVHWSDSGNDGPTGALASQELRYATAGHCPLASANFASGTVVAGLGTPGAAGTAESVTISGLSADTSWCAALKVVDAQGNAAFSASVSFHTLDDVPPDQPVLTFVSATYTTIDLSWIAVGDDGTTGTVQSRTLAYASGTDCDTFTSAGFDSATGVPLGTPAPGGAQETATVTGLSPDGNYCFMLRVEDDSQHVVFSDVLNASTPADSTPPGQPIVSAESATDTSIGLTWQAVASDGATDGGPARSYTLRYEAGASCDTFGVDNFSQGTIAPTGTPKAPGQIEHVLVSGLLAGTRYCFILVVTDEANNYNFATPVPLIVSTTGVNASAPAAVSDLRAAIIGSNPGGASQVVNLTWTAPAAGAEGRTLASYQLRYALNGACPITQATFAQASILESQAAPGTPGTHEAWQVSADISPTDGDALCFALVTTDNAGATSAISNSPQPPERTTDLSILTDTSGDTSASLAFTPPVFQQGTTAGEATVWYAPGNCPSYGSDVAAEDGAQMFDAGPAGGGSIALSGLAPATTYCVGLEIADTDGDVEWSDATPLTTTDNSPPGVPLAQVAAFNATSITVRVTTSVDNAQANTGVAPQYNVYYEALQDCTKFAVGDAQSVTVLASDAQVTQAGQPINATIDSLDSATQYCLAATAVNAGGVESGPSTVFAQTTASGGTGSTPPAAIGSLTAIVYGEKPQGSFVKPAFAVQPIDVELRWKAPKDAAGNGVASYNIYYATGASCPLSVSGLKSGSQISQNVTPGAPGDQEDETFTVTARYPQDTLCFNITSVDGAGNISAVSNDSLPPSTVTDLTFTAEEGSDTKQQVTFTPPTYQAGTAADVDTLYFAPQPDAGCPTEGEQVSVLDGVENQQLDPAASPPYEVTGLISGSAYCAVLQVATKGGDSTFSEPASFTATNSGAPSVPGELTEVSATTSSITIEFDASYANAPAQSGVATTYTVYYAALEDCGALNTNAPHFDVDVSANPPQFGGPVQPPGVIIGGLAKNTPYCISVQATNGAGLSSALAPALSASTSPDRTPPDAIVIQPAQPGDANSTAVTLRWIAPADDGSAATSGRVFGYEVYYVALTAADALEQNPCANVSTDNAEDVATQPTPSVDPGSLETVSVSPQPGEFLRGCFGAVAFDAAGNVSSPSNFVFEEDGIAPATPTLSAGAVTASSVELDFTAVADDGSTGTAATAYRLGYTVGACSGTFNFGAGTLVTGIDGPQAPGSPESITVSGLDYARTYCFGLVVIDAVGNQSGIATLSQRTASPDNSAEIATLRAQIESTDGSGPVAIGPTTVHGGVVTYIKSATAGSTVATDGAGFFLQPLAITPNAVPVTVTAIPAIYVQIDPSGVSVGDAVDLTATQGGLLGCAVLPCTNVTGAAVVTAGSVTVRSHGNAVASQDFSRVTLSQYPAPITTANWQYEYDLATFTGTISSPLASGAFTTYFFVDAGNTTGVNPLEVRVPTSLVTSLGLVSGQSLTIKNTPLWRTDQGAAKGVQVNPAIWSASDVVLGPLVTAVSPADGSYVTTTPSIQITFSQAMTAGTLTAQSAAGPCTGSVQLGTDGTFTNCLGVTSVTPNGSNTVFTVVPAGTLANNTRFQLRVTSAATASATSLALAQFSTTSGFETPQPQGATCTAQSPLILSQIYGGGGNSGATYKEDFIEVHNRSSADFTVPAGGYSVQYTSATSTAKWSGVTAIPAGTIIHAGGYLLVQENKGTGGTLDVGGDITGTIDLSGTAGRVALITGTTAIPAAFAAATPCPAPGTVVSGAGTILDFVAFGTTTSCTTNAAPAPSNTTSVQRNIAGCVDSATNALDFGAAAPVPRNSASAVQTCSCNGLNTAPSLNGAGAGAGEIGYCIDQFPTSTVGPIAHGTSAGTFYGRLFQNGITPGNQGGTLKAEVGLGPQGGNPFTQFAFTPATWNSNCASCGNNDEWQGSLTAPSLPGTYSWLYRFSLDSGAHWTYCDLNGNGSNGGLAAFDPNNLAQVVSQ